MGHGAQSTLGGSTEEGGCKTGKGRLSGEGFLPSFTQTLTALVCPLPAGPRWGLPRELLAGGGAVSGCAYPGYQVHVALQLLACQGPRRRCHLLCLRPPGCHGGEYWEEGIERGLGVHMAWQGPCRVRGESRSEGSRRLIAGPLAGAAA